MGVTSIPTWDVIFRRPCRRRTSSSRSGGHHAPPDPGTVEGIPGAALGISRVFLGADFGEKAGFGSQQSDGFGSQQSDFLGLFGRQQSNDLELILCPHELGTAPQSPFSYKGGPMKNVSYTLQCIQLHQTI